MVHKILIVDDSRVITMFVESIVKTIEGCEPYVMNDASNIIEVLHEEENVFDVIIIDRMMDEIDGIDILKDMKLDKELRHIPVIMLTGMDVKEDIIDGIKAGAFQYLTKPINHAELIDVIQHALIDSEYKRNTLESFRSNKDVASFVNSGNFEYKTVEQCNSLSVMLATCFPDPESAVIGLSEIMMNSIEHGNLGITCDEKKELLKKGKIFDEVSRRLELDKYKDRIVKVDYECNNKFVLVTIEDQGDGFNWKNYMQDDIEVGTTDFSGRGIMLSKTMSFDEVQYYGKGNKVTVKSYF